MEDKRFAELFTDPNFQINPESEEFKLLNPVVQKVNEKKLKKPKKLAEAQNSDQSDDENMEESDAHTDSNESSSSDDEHKWKQEIKDQYKKIKAEKKAKDRADKLKNRFSNDKNKSKSEATSAGEQPKQPKFFEIKDGFEYFSKNNKNSDNILKNENLKKLPLLNRLKHLKSNDASGNNDETYVFRSDSLGNKQMTFMSRKAKREKDSEKKAQEHHLERKAIRRSAGKITKIFQKTEQFKRRPK